MPDLQDKQVGGRRPVGYAVTEQVFPMPGDLYQPPGIFPLAFMLCKTCGFVRHFAWKRIAETKEAEKEAKAEKKDG